jgi:GLPGLI family protein
MPALRYLAAFSLLSFTLHTQAQEQNTIFLTEGKIEFEKKLNLYAQLDDDAWSDQQKKTMPQFKTSYFDLLFSGNKTLYRPGRENPDNSRLAPQPAEDNIIYSDLDNAKMIAQKKVFEQIFLVEDSVRKIRWKITDETRTIAGLECRRANALVMDSIYVVAFYTDEIISSGGPESFSGLPGMILGIALPHQHVTWFATRVQAIKVDEGALPAPQKGKKVTNASLKETLTESLKNWDRKFARQYIQATLL